QGRRRDQGHRPHRQRPRRRTPGPRPGRRHGRRQDRRRSQRRMRLATGEDVGLTQLGLHMWPYIGPYRTYTFVYIAAMIVHAGLAWRFARRFRFSWRYWVPLALCFTIAMSAGARVAYDLLHHQTFSWRSLITTAYYERGGL